MSNGKKTVRDRVEVVEKKIVKIETDLSWIKKLGFGFFGLLALNVVLNLLNLQPVKDWIF